MNEQELKNIWINHGDPDRVIIDPARLPEELDKQICKLQRNINRRDRRELAGAILLIPIAIYFTFTSPYLLMKIGFMLMFVHSFLVIYMIRKHKGKHLLPDSSSDHTAFLYSSKTYLLDQVQLLNNVLYWYVLPGFVAIALVLAGAKLSAIALIAALVLLAVFYVIILLLNKMAIKKMLMPIIYKINRIINDQNS